MLDVFAVLAEKHLDSVVTDQSDHPRHRRGTDRRRLTAGVRNRKGRGGRDA